MTPFAGTNVVTSIRGYRTLNGVRSFHYGVDVTNPNGDWKVREVTGGTVSKVYTTAARGLVLEVTAGNAVERYQHLKEALVKVGQKVPQGTIIATAGNSGECYGAARPDNGHMGGRHLHFEVLVNGVTSDKVSLWLGLPNALGTYPGDENKDGESEPTPPPTSKASKITITGPADVGFISSGDVAGVKAYAEGLGLVAEITKA